MRKKVLTIITAFMLGALSGCADTDNSLNSNGSNGNGLGGGLNPSDIKCEMKYNRYVDNFKEYREKFIHGDLFPASTPYDKYQDRYDTTYWFCPALSPNKYIDGYYTIEPSEITPDIGTYKAYRDYVEILKKVIRTNSPVNSFTDKCGNVYEYGSDGITPIKASYGCEFRGEMFNPRTGKIDDFGAFIEIDKQFKKVTKILLIMEYDYDEDAMHHHVPLNYVDEDDGHMINPPKVTEVPFQ